jgi:sugar (pentulose or hexulose) kinase
MSVLVVGIDSSTTATKAIAWDREGRMVAEGRASVPLFHPRTGWYEQDPEDWWGSTVEALRQLTRQVDPRRIAALAIANQRETFVPLDAQGNPLRPGIVWLDERCGAQVEKAIRELGREQIHRISGKPPDLTPILYRILWIREHEPEIFRRTRMYAEVHAYLVYRLVGSFRTSLASADPTGLLDMERACWSDTLLAWLRISEEQLPQLYLPGTPLGFVTERAARETGLLSGTPVIAGGGDGQCAGLGAGIVESERAYLNLGTAVVSGTFSSQYRYGPSFRTMCGCVPHTYILETVIRSGAFLVSWFRERFVPCRPQTELGLAVEEILELAATKVPPGARGLLLVPHWSASASPHWDTHARGVIVGWRGYHGLPEFYRALLEGICLEQRACLEALEKTTGIRVRQYVILGGGARSTLWTQLAADVLGRPCVLAGTLEATALGAGILAATGAGWFADVRDAVQSMVHWGKLIEPIATHHLYYSRLYEDVYCHLYDTLRPLVHRLSALEEGEEGKADA